MVNSSATRSRPLTENEAIVVKSILGASIEETEADRIRRCGLPRSTYLEAKQRVYAEGLIQDRYVPSSRALGLSRISFVLSRPFADKRGPVTQALLSTPGTVLVWTGVHVQMGVVIHRTEADLSRFEERVERLLDGGALIGHVRSRPIPEDIPVYFDFEGIWSSFVGTLGVRKYPRAFPSVLHGEDTGMPASPPSEVVSDLLRKHIGEEESPSPHLVGPASLSRSRKKALEDGKVEWRTFLSVGLPISFGPNRLADIVLVVGRREKGRTLTQLLEELVTDCTAFPFLVAGDEDQVLIGFMGAGLGANGTTSRKVGTNVSSSIVNSVSHLEILREGLGLVTTQRDHQYEYLL
jgi:hypothetical protein